MLKKYLFSFFVISGVLLLISGKLTVYAVNATNTAKMVRPNSALNATIKEERCSLLKNRIVARINLYDENKISREALYINIKQKIVNVVKLLKEKGYDTSKLEADLPGWDSLVAKFSLDRKTFMTTLSELREVVCLSNASEYKDKLQEAKDQLSVVKTDAANIRDYFNNTIKLDIKQIKAQKVDLKSKTGGSEQN